jgi:hypothetical protein
VVLAVVPVALLLPVVAVLVPPLEPSAACF